MKDTNKTKEQLINELTKLRRQIADLEQPEIDYKKTEMLLHENEESYKSLVENVNVGVYRNTIVGKGEFLQANPALANIFGYDSVDDFMKITVADLNRDTEVRKHLLNEVLQNGFIKNKELKLQKKDGSSITVSCTAKIRYDEKNNIKWIDGIIEDITKRKQAADALQSSEERLREITENISDLVSICDFEGILQYASPSHKIILGYESEYLIGKSCFDLIHPDDLNNAISVVVDDGSASRQKEARFKCADGSYKWIETIGKAIFNEKGEPVRIILNSRDISDRKSTEKVLTRIAQALESSSEAIGMSDPEGNHFYQNKAFTDLFGFASAEELQSEGGGPRLYSNNDIADDVFDSIKNGNSWIGEIEMISKNGREFPVFLRADTVRDNEGNSIGLIGLHTDITQRKEVEKKLIQTLEEVHNLSLTDDLTALYNRRGFLTLAQQQLKIADRMKDKILLLYADMDNLKLINDTYGHQEGDLALIEIANCFNETFRESDIIARIGGDEFVALTIETSDASAGTLINRLQSILDNNSKRKHPYNISISIGTAYYNTENPCSIEELLDRADKIMYERKRIKQENIC